MTDPNKPAGDKKGDISGDAAAWLVRLDGHSSPQTWEAFVKWMESDRRNEAAFIRLRTAWTQYDRLKHLRPADGRIAGNVLDNLPDDPRPVVTSDREDRVDYPQYIDRRRWLMYVGATAAATAGVGMLGWLSAEHRRWTYFETGVGGNRREELLDRSQVLLNTDSRLRVRLGNDGRRDSELIRGEALFTVAHDKLRPFYVKAVHTLVCGMGTSFSVRIHENREVEVLVAQGRVAIGSADPAAPAGTPVLTNSAPQAATDQSVVMGPDSLIIKQQAPGYVARRLAWTAGNISFDGETLTEAVREFNRYNRRHIAIADPAIAQMKVGGSFEANDPESFAATLEKHFGVRRIPAARGDNNVIRLVSADRRTDSRP
jgi:transmembrane sensor